MIRLDEHIEYLIVRHDCVVIPGWGALIAQHVPAHYDDELECIFPPARTVAFNASVQHDDGLLASSVARRHRLGYEQASAYIAEKVAEMHSCIDHDRELAIGRLGVFRHNSEGAIVFEPFTSSNFAPELTGLIGTSAIDLGKTTISRHENNRREGITLRSVMKAAASVALLIGLGIMLYTPVVDNRAAYAGVASTVNRLTRAAAATTITLTAPADLAIALPDPASGIGIATPRTSAETVIPNDTPSKFHNALRCDASDRYFLVIASLPTRYSAQEYIDDHKGSHDLHILESGGRYRIYVATGNSVSQTRAPMADETFASRYPSAWVCRP